MWYCSSAHTDAPGEHGTGGKVWYLRLPCCILWLVIGRSSDLCPAHTLQRRYWFAVRVDVVFGCDCVTYLLFCVGKVSVRCFVFSSHCVSFVVSNCCWKSTNVIVSYLFLVTSWSRLSVLWHCWLGVRKSIRPVKIEWWGVGVVICLERGADCLHMV